MNGEIPDKFNGFILPNGRCVSIENTDAIFKLITSRYENREMVCGALRGFFKECLDSGLLKAALSYLEKELSITDDPQEQARIHLSAGIVFERAGDYQAAATRYKAAFLRNILVAGRKAEEYLKKSAEVASQIGASGILGQASLGLGLLYKSKGKTDEAIKRFSEAIEAFEKSGAEGYLKQAREAWASCAV